MKMHNKNQKKEDQKTSNCVDCPICSNCTFLQTHSIEWVLGYFEIDYPTLSSGSLPDFAQAQWKPPNA
jgi:hypothetical protein